MKILFRLLVSAWLLCFSVSVYSASIPLQQNQWNMLVLPADPADKTIGGLFGDELGVNDYCDLTAGTGTWCVWTYDAGADTYINPSVGDSLALGQAFWILQAAAPTVNITLPEGSPQPTDFADANCMALGGCLSIPLATDAFRPITWSMVGSPYGWSTQINDLLFQTTTNTHPCETGCALDTAGFTHQLTAGLVWIWNPDNTAAGNYEQRSSGDLVRPWQGFWASAMPAAASLGPVLKFPDTTAFADVRGFVRETGGDAAAGLTVEVVGSAVMTTTDANGEFTLTLASDQQHVLKFESPDYATQILVVDLPVTGGRVDVSIDVLRRSTPVTFSTDSFFNSIFGPDGTTVEMEGATFSDENGGPVSGNIQVSITPVDVSSNSRGRAFPGTFTGVPENGDPESALVSQGTVEFHFTHDGEEVFLESGDVQIALPIYTTNYPDGTAISVGDSIPLWSLEEESGVWEQEGVGVVIADARSPSGLSLLGSVTHFSWWNCDVRIEVPAPQPNRGGAGYVRVLVAAGLQTGMANIYGDTTANLGWRATSVSTTANINEFTRPLPVPANAEVCFRAEIVFDSFLRSGSARECVTVARGETVDLVLNANSTIADLSLYAYLADENGEGSSASLDVTGFIGYEISQINFVPFSLESLIDYSVTDLPPGLMFNLDGNVRAEITGVPTTPGQYTTTVTGMDLSGNSESIVITYTMSPDPEPPALDDGDRFGFSDNIFISLPFSLQGGFAEDTIVDLQIYNSGGIADSWTLTFDGGPSVNDVALDPVTGELVIDGLFQGYLSGTLRAENSSGADEIFIEIADAFGGEGGPNLAASAPRGN